MRTALGQAERQKGRAIDGTFEPRVRFMRPVEVQVYHHPVILFAGKLSHLQAADMRGSFPVHVPRALQRLIGADAVEVVAAAALRSEEHTSELQSRFGISYA